MQRFCAVLAYQGADYQGFQAHPHNISIQAHLESALSKVACHPVSVICAGRTDSGVHATYQVIHFDVQNNREAEPLMLGSNRFLPKSIRLLSVVPAPNDFHARFDARLRYYRYFIWTSKTPLAPQLTQGALYWRGLLDIDAMNQALKPLLGKHDFSSFRDKQCQSKSPERRLSYLNVQQQGPWVMVDVVANAFLHHMVRNLVGTLLEIGRGLKNSDHMAQVLAKRDRSYAGKNIEATGLFLVGVRYPQDRIALLDPNTLLDYMPYNQAPLWDAF